MKDNRHLLQIIFCIVTGFLPAIFPGIIFTSHDLFSLTPGMDRSGEYPQRRKHLLYATINKTGGKVMLAMSILVTVP